MKHFYIQIRILNHSHCFSSNDQEYLVDKNILVKKYNLYGYNPEFVKDRLEKALFEVFKTNESIKNFIQIYNDLSGHKIDNYPFRQNVEVLATKFFQIQADLFHYMRNSYNHE